MMVGNRVSLTLGHLLRDLWIASCIVEVVAAPSDGDDAESGEYSSRHYACGSRCRSVGNFVSSLSF